MIRQSGGEIQDDREVLRGQLEHELKRRVHLFDDPGVSAVLTDGVALQLLEQMRVMDGPMTLSSLLSLKVARPIKIKASLQRLVEADFVRIMPARGRRVEQYLANERVCTVAHDGSPAADRLVKRHREVVANLMAKSDVGNEVSPFLNLSTEPYLNRVFSLNARAHARLREAVYRAFSEFCQIIDEEGAAEEWSAATRHIHIRVDGVFVAEKPMQAAPMLLLNTSARGLVGGWMERVGSQLTPRQRDVVQILMNGATRAEVAEELGISENTVKSNIREIYKRLGVKNRAELVQTLKP